MFDNRVGHHAGHTCCAWCSDPIHLDIFYVFPGDQELSQPGDIVMSTSDGYIEIVFEEWGHYEIPPADFDPQAPPIIMCWRRLDKETST